MCLFASACASADATDATGDPSAADTHLGIACRDLPAVYGPWFSEAVTSTVVVERLELFPVSSQRSLTGLEMDRVASPTNALYDTVIGYSNLYMRDLSSALVMYRAEIQALAAHGKQHDIRAADTKVVELVHRIRWAFDQITIAWANLRTLCPPSSPAPSRNLPTVPDTQAIQQVGGYLAVIATAFPLPSPLPDNAVRPVACDGPDAHAGDGRYRIGMQAEVPVKPKHLDAIVRLASLLRVMYQVTVLRETVTGTGQADMAAYDMVTGTRITLASVNADTMRLTVHSGCALPPPGQSPPVR